MASLTVRFFRGAPVVFKSVDAESVFKLMGNYRRKREVASMTVEGFTRVPVVHERGLFDFDVPIRGVVGVSL